MDTRYDISMNQGEATIVGKALAYLEAHLKTLQRQKSEDAGMADISYARHFSILQEAGNRFVKVHTLAKDGEQACSDCGLSHEHLEAASAAVRHYYPWFKRNQIRAELVEAELNDPAFRNFLHMYPAMQKLRSTPMGIFTKLPFPTVRLSSKMVSTIRFALGSLSREYKREAATAEQWADARDATLHNRVAILLDWRERILRDGQKVGDDLEYATTLLHPPPDYPFLLSVLSQVKHLLAVPPVKQEVRDRIDEIEQARVFLGTRYKETPIKPCLFTRPQDPPNSPFSFVTDLDFRRLIERDYRELISAKDTCVKATVVLSGAILEALLDHFLDRLDQEQPGWKQHQKIRDPNKPPLNVPGRAKKMQLWEKIEVFNRLKLFPPTNQTMFDPLRDYRNYVHPSKEHELKVMLTDSRMLKSAI